MSSSVFRVLLSALFGTRRPTYLLILIAGLAVLFGVHYGLGLIFTPWARPYPGHPALVGYWEGEVQFEPGDRRRIALQLTEIYSRYQGTRIGGAAKLCGSHGANQYSVFGSAKNREGTDFSVGLATDEPEPGRHLTGIEGNWDGADLVRVRARPYTVGPDGVVRGEASIDAETGRVDFEEVLTMELHRTTKRAFKAACPEAR